MSLFKFKKADLWDQPAHFCTAFLTVFVAAKLGAPIGPAAGAWLGLMLGLVREITEEKEIRVGSIVHIVRSSGSRLDLVSWTLGGLAAGAL